jgi:hypothetical protein
MQLASAQPTGWYIGPTIHFSLFLKRIRIDLTIKLICIYDENNIGETHHTS